MVKFRVSAGFDAVTNCIASVFLRNVFFHTDAIVQLYLPCCSHIPIGEICYRRLLK